MDDIRETQQGKRQRTLEELARAFDAYRSENDRRLRDGDERMTRIELAAERMAGSVEMFPQVFDAKFDGLIQLIKTRDGIIVAAREGRDIENKPPTKSELSWGKLSLRLPPPLLVFAFISSVAMLSVICGGCYLVIRHWDRVVAPATVGGR